MGAGDGGVCYAVPRVLRAGMALDALPIRMFWNWTLESDCCRSDPVIWAGRDPLLGPYWDV